MTRTKTAKYPNPRLEALHQTAQSLARVGGLDKITMRDIDRLCLTKTAPLSAAEIRAIRQKAGVSQAIFAEHIGVTAGLVSKWECGEKKPSGPSLKLLSLVKAKGLASVA